MLFLNAIARAEAVNVDFGDAYIAAAAFETYAPPVSFDRDLDKFSDVKRVEP